MASKRHLRRKACEGKIKFADFKSAHQACISYKHKFGHYMRAYPCRFCSGYHIGHPTRDQRRALAAQRGF